MANERWLVLKSVDLIFEKLHQHWRVRLRLQHVRLPFERAVLRVRQYARERLVRVEHPRRAIPTVHDECRYRDGRPPAGPLRLAPLVVPHDRAVVRARVRNAFTLPPHRYHQWHQCPDEARNSDRLQEELDCIASPICRDRRADPVPIVLGCGTGVVHDERRLVQRQLLDATEAIRRFQCKNCAGGHAPDKRRPTRFAQERWDVFALALHGIGRPTTTAASTSTVVGEDGEVLCQELSQLPTLTHTSVAERAIDQNHRRSVTDSIECYRRTVLREHFSHKRGSHLLPNLWGSPFGSF